MLRYIKKSLISSLLIFVVALSIVGSSRPHHVSGAATKDTTGSTVLWRFYGTDDYLDGTNASDVKTIVNTGDGEFHPMLFTIECESCSGLLTGALLSVGTAPNYNNIYNGVVTPTGNGAIRIANLDTTYAVIGSNTDIKAKIATAATGLGGQVQHLRVAVAGHTGFP